jgi:thioredoxin-dependent peroxiredoxin
MSKKSHKKSSKPPSARPPRAKSPGKTKAKAASARPPAAKRSSGKTTASHATQSKPLKKSAAPARPAAGTATAAVPAEGDKAPTFGLPRDGGTNISSKDFLGKKLVLFFYPKADTPGCTKEAIDFSRLRDAFAEIDTEVIGISADTVKIQDAFRDKHKLSVPLLSDEKHAMLEAYGAWGEKSMYGRKFMGIVRTTVLIGVDGKIARLWRKVRVDGHADDVLAAAKAL